MPVSKQPAQRTCRACGLSYVPDARNRDRQKYCTRRACVRRRKRDRQRLWHRDRYASDASYREAVKLRVRGHRRRQNAVRAQQGGRADTHPVFLGLAMTLTGEHDPARARDLVSAWGEFGRRCLGSLASGP